MKYFNDYKNTKSGFDLFHNQVINMPRSDFSAVGFDRLSLLAEYLILFDTEFGHQDYYNYKSIYKFFLNKYKNNSLNLNEKFENYYFKPYINMSINDAYGDDGIGRMFRHEMGIASFFELIDSKSRQKKRVNIAKCNEFIKTPSHLLSDLQRNSILSVQTNTNPYIKGIRGIAEFSNVNYKPSYAILEYINSIGRPATDFELSILLGRLGDNSTEEEIVSRALDIGKTFPQNKEDQINFFFEVMGWINADGNNFSYKTSQGPYFKFKVYLLYMVEFGLLIEVDNNFLLSDYSKMIINDDLDPYIIDLDNLIKKIEEIEHPNEVIDMVLNSRTLTLENLLRTQDDLITKLGIRSLKERELRNKFGGSNKNVRNNLIMFFAKYLQENICKVTTSFIDNRIEHHYESKTFESSSGRYYSEGHHILELSKDNGPDIIENIILMDPNTHKLIHSGNREDVKKFYSKLRDDGILTVDRFENMIKRYNCLNRNHVDILLENCIIDKESHLYLVTKINDRS